jgi:hypothetical protein
MGSEQGEALERLADRVDDLMTDNAKLRGERDERQGCLLSRGKIRVRPCRSYAALSGCHEESRSRRSPRNCIRTSATWPKMTSTNQATI